MREAFCPEASTVEERTACYQMITEALKIDRLAGNQSKRSAPKPTKSSEEGEINLGEELGSEKEAEEESKLETATLQRSADEKKLGEKTASKENKENKERKRFQLFGWAKSDKDEDYGPEWTKVRYVRRESSGAELVVLEDGQVWGEIKRNGFVTLSKGDWVKIRGASRLVRRGGGTTEVEALNCNKDDLKGRCRGLKKIL